MIYFGMPAIRARIFILADGRISATTVNTNAIY